MLYIFNYGIIKFYVTNRLWNFECKRSCLHKKNPQKSFTINDWWVWENQEIDKTMEIIWIYLHPKHIWYNIEWGFVLFDRRAM